MGTDPELGQVFTPITAMDRGFTLVDVVAERACMVYKRAVGQHTHYVVTRTMLVMALTTDRHVAEYAAGVKYTCDCKSFLPPCINAVLFPGSLCLYCVRDDHSGHR